MIRVAILTVSDSCAKGQQEDISGQTIKDMLGSRLAGSLPEDSFEICRKKIVADDHEKIVNELKHFSDKTDIDVVFTIGGIGLEPRDVTPEATASVCERIVPGFGEIMRA